MSSAIHITDITFLSQPKHVYTYKCVTADFGSALHIAKIIIFSFFNKLLIHCTLLYIAEVK